VCQAATGVPLFIDDLDRTQLLDELRSVARDLGWQVIAYCLMTTHVHIVVCTPEPNLAAGMRRLQGRYSSAHNRRHGRRGHLFGGRYWSRRIDRPHYLWCAALYAVLNPVAAGLCAHPRDYAWSSYGETVGAIPASGLLEVDILLRTFHEQIDQSRRVYAAVVEDALLRLARRRADEKWWQTVESAAPGARTTG
jgi:REP element-mobilizing transposase RayT